jgi:hypothetical protein
MKYLISNKWFAVLSALFMLASCEETLPTREPSPEVSAGNPAVRFAASNQTSFELEPGTPDFTILALRDLTQSSGAFEVPVIVDANTENAFVVPSNIVFPAGKDTVEVIIGISPSAPAGVSLSLSISVGEQYIHTYKAEYGTYVGTVSLIKWDIMEPFVWVDGTIGTFWGVEQRPMYVHTEQANVGSSVRYRFKNPFFLATEIDDDGIYNGYSYSNSTTEDHSRDWYVLIEVDRDGNVSMYPSDLGFAWQTYGMFSIGSIYGNVRPELDLYPLGTLEDDVITFPENSLYCSMAAYNNGGKYPASTPTYIYLTKEAYIAANKKIKDFNDIEYEIIPGAVSEFMSNAFEESWGQPLAKAIDIDEENPDSEYKNLYYLGDVYVPDFGIAFYYNGQSLRVPANQPIGVSAFREELFVSQSEEIESLVSTTSKGVTVYTLGLKFHYEDGTVLGHFAETFYYSEDPVSYSINDFYGNYHVTGPCAFDGYPDADMNVRIAAGSSANSMVITGVEYVESLAATFDPATSTIAIVPQVLADFEGDDMTFYTYILPGYYSANTPLQLGFNMAGQLAKTANSEADGYLLRSESGGGWVDGYYNLIFTPQAAQKAPRKATLSAPIAKPLQKITIEKAKEGKSLKKGNFVNQGKPNPKKLKTISGLTPVL